MSTSSSKKKRKVMGLCIRIADYLLQEQIDTDISIAAVELRDAAADVLAQSNIKGSGASPTPLCMSVAETLAFCSIGVIDLDMNGSDVGDVKDCIFKLTRIYAEPPTEKLTKKYREWVAE